jgi:hypothetical protein
LRDDLKDEKMGSAVEHKKIMISELYICLCQLPEIVAVVNQWTQFWANWQLRKGNALNVVPIFLDNF